MKKFLAGFGGADNSNLITLVSGERHKKILTNMDKPVSKDPHSKGFALVVTLSLMILLTIIAVGLLSLSAVTLRSSSQGVAQAEAQAKLAWSEHCADQRSRTLICVSPKPPSILLLSASNRKVSMG